MKKYPNWKVWGGMTLIAIHIYRIRKGSRSRTITIMKDHLDIFYHILDVWKGLIMTRLWQEKII